MPSSTSAAVPQTCRDTIYRKMDATHNTIVLIAVPIALEQFQLYIIKGIDVGKSVADDTRQRRIALERRPGLQNRQQRFERILPFGVEALENRVAAFWRPRPAHCSATQSGCRSWRKPCPYWK